MKNKLTITYIILVLLTILSTLISGTSLSMTIVIGIVAISVIKFILVGWEFMELKQAHTFWKSIYIVYSVFLGGFFVILLH